MCLVEIEKFPKPVASCAMPLADNMVIYVDTPLVRKARESVLEFLLINHPLDCPICDQGGECDLQDQTIKYGSNQSRFLGGTYKRGVQDKNFGVLIKTVMTRCIHCTRCVRYADEIAGTGRFENSLGTSGRGKNVEIGFYIDKIFNSELSGNVIDLCPVGALTSKPQAFEYRSWELETYSTIDTNDALGIPIQVDVKDNKIVRIKPNQNAILSDTWISDKTRYSFDGLNYQRIRTPQVFNRIVSNSNSNSATAAFILSWWWLSILLTSSAEKTLHLTGSHVSIETLEELKTLTSVNNTIIESLTSTPICLDFEKNYKLDLLELESNSNPDFILLISNNLRYELPNLNIKFKQLKQKNNTIIAYIGTYYENTYDMEHLGLSLDVLHKIIKGKHKYSIYLKKAKNPKIFVGSLTTTQKNTNNSFQTQNLVKSLQKILNTMVPSCKAIVPFFVPSDISTTGAMDLGIKKAIPKIKEKTNIKNIHLTNVEDLSALETQFLNDKNLIIGGHHMVDFLPKSREMCLTIPFQTAFESAETFLNLEGRLCQTKKVFEDGGRPTTLFYSILNILNNKKLPILNKKSSILAQRQEPPQHDKNRVPTKRKHEQHNTKNIDKNNKKKIKFLNIKLNTRIVNFYKTDHISKNSKILNNVTKSIKALPLLNF